MKKAQKNHYRKTKAGISVFIVTAIASLALLALTACKPMLLQDIAGYVPVYSQVVGPDGGTVTDSRGASVEIPAGALAGISTITIATYSDGGDIYSRHGVTPFTGGADFGPDGIEFLKPVTITLPSARRLVPGQTQPLFMHNPGTGAWDMTTVTLTAAEDGWSATAEVTHFTPYVSSLLPPDALSKIEEFFDGTNGQVALGSYMAWFLTATDLYGYTAECGNSVYEVVGLFFDFTWQVDGVPGTAVSEYGDVSLDTVAQLSYAYDTASTDGPEYIYNMLVTVYFDVTENPPEAEPHISILEPIPGITVEGIETISTYIVTGDSETDIDSVAFYADGSLLGSDTEAPFQWYWDTDSLADGEHTLTATAAFSIGESVESESVTVVVGDGEEEPSGTNGPLLFNPLGGKVTKGDAVSLSVSESGASIYYTLDGTTPDPSTSEHYSSPINIEYPTTITASVQYSDGSLSEPENYFYWYIPTNSGKIAFLAEDFIDGSWNYIGTTIADPTVSGYSMIPSSDVLDPYIFAPEANSVIGTFFYVDQNLYDVNVLSGNAVNLTNNSYSNQAPDISLDGSRIVYRSNRNGNMDLYIMNRDGSNEIRLTTHEKSEMWPQFSPDGTKVLFCSYLDNDSKPEVYIMNSDGTNKKRLTNNTDIYESYPCFSPDQKKIAYQGGDDIYIMDLDGENKFNVTSQITATDIEVNPYGRYNYFSPDGTKLILSCKFSNRWDVYTINIDGTELTNVTENINSGNSKPSYSPNGSKIIFQSTVPGYWEIYSINADGTNPINLTNAHEERLLSKPFTSR